MIVTTKEFFVPGVPLFNCYDQSSLPDSSQRDIRAMVEVMGFPGPVRKFDNQAKPLSYAHLSCVTFDDM